MDSNMHSDRELCEFYSTFFKQCLKLNETSNVKKFEKFLTPKQKLEEAVREPEQISFSENDHYRVRFAYIFENSIYVSSLVTALFKSLLDKNADLLRTLLAQNIVSICCFSNGSCAEVVSIVQVLARAAKHNSSHLHFKVTVLCFTKHWRKISLKILNCLEKYELQKDHVQFIKINLSSKFPAAIQQIIKNADIVTMVKFFSAVIGSRRFWEIYRDICQHAQPKSLIFFLDSAYRNFFDSISRQFSSCMKLDHNNEYRHFLNWRTVQRNFKPFDHAFENYFPLRTERVSFCFWVKVENDDCTGRSFNIQNVVVETVEEKAVSDACSRGNLHKMRDEQKSESETNIITSPSARNCKHVVNISSESKPEQQADPFSEIGNSMDREVLEEAILDSKKVETNKTDMKTCINFEFSKQPIVRSEQKETEDEEESGFQLMSDENKEEAKINSEKKNDSFKFGYVGRTILIRKQPIPGDEISSENVFRIISLTNKSESLIGGTLEDDVDKFAYLKNLKLPRFSQGKTKKSSQTPKRKKKKKAVKYKRISLSQTKAEAQQQKESSKNKNKGTKTKDGTLSKIDPLDLKMAVINLAADYSNNLSTKVNLIMREDVVKKARKEQNPQSKNQVSAYLIDDFVPAFNQSCPKKQRWDYWWKKWNWI